MAVTHPRGIDRSVAIGLSGEESATEERGIEVLADIKAEFDKRSRRSSQRMCRHPRLERSQEAKGYRRARFDDAFDRYLTPANDASRQTRGPQASERSSADGMGTTSDFCVRPNRFGRMRKTRETR
jgi:hypothetical protein